MCEFRCRTNFAHSCYPLSDSQSHRESSDSFNFALATSVRENYSEIRRSPPPASVLAGGRLLTSVMANTSNKLDMLFEVTDSISDKETMEIDPPKSQKRKHPSRSEKIPVKKGLINNEKIQPGSSSTSSIISTLPNTIENKHFRFRSTDIGPFNIMISIRKKDIKEGTKSPSNTTVARDLVKKYNICFNNMARKGKFQWLISFDTREKANYALNNSLLDESMFSAEVPWYMAFRRFVINGIAPEAEEEEILEELQVSNPTLHITDICRFKKKVTVDGKTSLVPSQSIKVTIRGQRIPEFVYAWQVRTSTRIYIPSIRKCFNCGQLSHSTKFCVNHKVCLHCGQEYDESHAHCSLSSKCTNCGGSHPALDIICSVVKEKQKITKIMACENVNYSEARAILYPRHDINPRLTQSPTNSSEPSSPWSRTPSIRSPILFNPGTKEGLSSSKKRLSFSPDTKDSLSPKSTPSSGPRGPLQSITSYKSKLINKDFTHQSQGIYSPVGHDADRDNNSTNNSSPDQSYSNSGNKLLYKILVNVTASLEKIETSLAALNSHLFSTSSNNALHLTVELPELKK